MTLDVFFFFSVPFFPLNLATLCTLTTIRSTVRIPIPQRIFFSLFSLLFSSNLISLPHRLFCFYQLSYPSRLYRVQMPC